MVVRAARYLGVSPWELYEQPYFWTLRAINAESADGAAQERANKAPTMG
jgi:hypothetical protein